MHVRSVVVILACSLLSACKPFAGVDCTGLGQAEEVRVQLLEPYSEESQYTFINGDTFDSMQSLPSCEALGVMPTVHEIRVGENRGQGGNNPRSACLTYVAELQNPPPFDSATTTETTYGRSSVAGLQGDVAATYDRVVGPNCVAREFFYVSVWPSWEYAADPEADRSIFGVATPEQPPPAVALRHVFFSGSDCSVVPDEIVAEGCFDLWAAQVTDLTVD